MPIKGQLTDRTGEVSYTKYGTEARIIKYFGRNDIVVQFQDNHKYEAHSTYKCFKEGILKNPYDRTMFGIGYIGVGKYNTKENGCNTKAYNCWANMFIRCYDNENRKKCHIRYVGCSVCEEWHNFQIFADWYYKNYFDSITEKTNIDKDILIKGNKIYSPETCCFVPESINVFFTKSNLSRGKYPIGVSEDKNRNCFVAACTNKYADIKKSIYKRFNTYEEAFICYKQFKENCCKEMAEYYKSLISQSVYEALMSYTVDIND